jgi:hypothetical protein
LIDLRRCTGDGSAEGIVADAIQRQRQGVLVVTKDCPHNALQAKLLKTSECVDLDGQKSDSHAGEHCGIFGDERGQLRMRGLELFNGLF